MSPSQYLAVRYGRNQNSQPYGADPQVTPNGWGDSENKFNSINLNHNWVIGGSMLNEFIFQYADFQNHIGANSQDTRQTFPNGVAIGQNPNTPQTTAQKKWQFRDDFSWSVSGMGGLGHAFKAGVNFINEPRLYVTFEAGKDVWCEKPMTRTIGEGREKYAVKKYGRIVAITSPDNEPSIRLLGKLGFRFERMTRLADDAAEAAYFAPDQLPRNLAFASTRRALLRWRCGQSKR